MGSSPHGKNIKFNFYLKSYKMDSIYGVSKIYGLSPPEALPFFILMGAFDTGAINGSRISYRRDMSEFLITYSLKCPIRCSSGSIRSGDLISSEVAGSSDDDSWKWSRSVCFAPIKAAEYMNSHATAAPTRNPRIVSTTIRDDSY